MKKLPESKAIFGPYEILRESTQKAADFVLFRPVLFLFAVTFVLLAYAVFNNRKFQKILLTLPYDRFYHTIKSDRMITFYATVAEVVLEVATAIILAGVSILITSWLLLEEAIDRKQQKIALNVKPCPRYASDFVLKKCDSAIPQSASQNTVHSRFTQQKYTIPQTQSSTHRR